MPIDFKNLKRRVLNVGLSAILASSALGINEADGATSSYKDADRIEYNIKDIEARWAEQEKQLTSEQKALWKQMQKDKRFKNILPRILDQLDITKIKKTDNGSTIEFAEGTRLSYRTDKDGFYIVKLREAMKDNLIPAYDMSDFMTDKLECFFISQPEDKNLTLEEQKIIQTLDKCLNAVYAFVYARGTANIDEKAFLEGDYAGMILDIRNPTTPKRPNNRLTPEEAIEHDKMLERKIYDKCFYYTHVNDLKADYPKFTKKYTDLENEFFMVIGYPYDIKDLMDMGARISLAPGGCAGEMAYNFSFDANTFGVPWVCKPTKRMVQQTLSQFTKRTLQGMEGFALTTGNAFKEQILKKYNIDLKNKSKLTTLQKAILKRYEVAESYNHKIINFAKSANKVPKSLAHLGFLNNNLSNNFKILQTKYKVDSHSTTKAANIYKNMSGTQLKRSY